MDIHFAVEQSENLFKTAILNCPPPFVQAKTRYKGRVSLQLLNDLQSFRVVA